MLLPKVTNMTKWWHFQFVGTHALRQDMLYPWGETGTLGIQNRVKENWIIDEILFDFLKNPKSRAADYRASSLSHESCPRTSWFCWDLIPCSWDSVKASFSGLTLPILGTLSVISLSIQATASSPQHPSQSPGRQSSQHESCTTA